MSKKTTTTMKINIEAEYKSLEKLGKELDNIKGSAVSLGLTKDDVKILEEIILSVKSLQSLYDKRRGDGFNIDTKSYKELSRLFDDLTKKSDKLGKSLIKISGLGGAKGERLTEILNETDALRERNRQAGLEKSKQRRQFNAAKNAKTAEVVREQFPKATDTEGHLLTKFDDLQRAYEEISGLGRELTEREQAIVQAYNKVHEIVQLLEKDFNKGYDAQSAIIDENKRKIQELEKEAKGILAAVEADPSVSEENKRAAESFLSTVTDMKDASLASGEALEASRRATTSTTEGHTLLAGAVSSSTDKFKKQDSVLGKAVHNVISYGSALAFVRSVYTKLIQTITEMDAALTGMTVVTQLTREQAWALTGTLQSLAKETGMTSTEIANMTTMYLQQGETLDNSLKLTEAAAKAARIAGISGSESINLLTNAMNGFQMSAEQAMDVSDKFAALAAEAATDYEELATALSKVAAQANLAGMSMDFTLGLLTKGIEVTREAPETIGTALKTVISRMRELTDYGETLEDGVDVNRVQTALSVIGVELLDQNRQFRDLEEVLTEVGEKWDTLTTNQQANVAVALAGTRQQSRLIAMMQDFDRTQELVNISMNSAGATAAQHRKYMEGLEAATTALTTSYQELITNFTNSDLIIEVINAGAVGLEYFANNLELVGLAAGGLTTALILLNAQQLISKFLNLDIFTSTKQNVLAKIQETLATKQGALADLNASLAKGLLTDAEEAERKELLADIAVWENYQKQLIETGVITGATTKETIGLTLGLNGAATAAGTATSALEILKNKFREFITKNWVMLIIAAVVALAAAWYAANKETEKGKELAGTISKLFNMLIKSATSLLSPIISIVEVLVELIGVILTIVEGPLETFATQLEGIAFIIDVIVSAINWLIGWLGKGLKFLSDFTSKLDIDMPEWLRSLLKGGGILGALGGLVKDFDLDKWTKSWTLEDRLESATNKIEELQNAAYDNRKLSDTLTPLLNEYEELSSKAIKTTEDLGRLKEIESEIGELDAQYLTESGVVNTDAVKQAIDTANTEAKQQTEDAYRTALEAINDRKASGKAGEINDTMRSGISDYWSYQATQVAEISASAARNVSSNFEAAINSMSDEELRVLSASDKAYDKLYNSMLQFELQREEIIEDPNKDDGLAAQFKIYQDQLKQVPDDAKDAFKSVYSLYSSYADLMQKLNITGQNQTKFLNAVDTMGLTQEEIEDIYAKYQSSTGGSREQAENWFASNIWMSAQKGSDPALALIQAAQALGGKDKGLANLIQNATLSTAQDISEKFTTKASEAQNIGDYSRKIATGALTSEEIRKLEQEFPEIFNKDELYSAFMSGTLSSEQFIQDAAKQSLEDIERLFAVTEVGSAEYKALMLQKDYYSNAVLYSSKLWENLAETTTEMVKQARIQDELNTLKEEYDKADTEEERLAIANKILAKSQELRDVYAEIYNSDFYKDAVSKGYIVDGKIIMTQEELKKEDSSLAKWLDAHYDVIEEASEAQEKYIDELHAIVEEEYEYQKQLLDARKESYENYFERLDALEEERDRTEQKESIIGQLSALSTATGGNSKQIQKDLLAQLKSIQEEEEDARKQAIRDDALKNIDDHVANIDNKIEAAAKEQNAEVLLGILKEQFGIVPKYKEGGLVDFTGPAWVDGSKSRPEAFLDSFDTANIQALTAILESIFNLGADAKDLQSVTSINTDNSVEQSVVVEAINIYTEALNNNQDFRSAGTLLAQEFAKIINERGLNVNTKK